MRRALHLLGTLMVVAGLGTLGWAVLVWQWQDPVTALYEWREQGRLDDAYDARARDFALPAATLAKASPADLRKAAARFRTQLRRGEPVGVLTIGRLGLKKVVVNGTDHDSLTRGPGRDQRTFMPGEGRLVYIAGHRTTYGAPFSHIDELRKGDYVKLEVPYGTFTYRVTGHVVVAASDVDRLRTRGREELALQACHPRFFASHRYITYAKLTGWEPNGAPDGAVALGAS
jgi:sortase A